MPYYVLYHAESYCLLFKKSHESHTVSVFPQQEVYESVILFLSLSSAKIYFGNSIIFVVIPENSSVLCRIVFLKIISYCRSIEQFCKRVYRPGQNVNDKVPQIFSLNSPKYKFSKSCVLQTLEITKN